jgi:hypothetical protein
MKLKGIFVWVAFVLLSLQAGAQARLVREKGAVRLNRLIVGHDGELEADGLG